MIVLYAVGSLLVVVPALLVAGVAAWSWMVSASAVAMSEALENGDRNLQ